MLQFAVSINNTCAIQANRFNRRGNQGDRSPNSETMGLETYKIILPSSSRLFINRWHLDC